MINNKVIENELNDLEHEMSDLLARIKQLRKEVSEIAPKQKVLYEQNHTFIKDFEYKKVYYDFKSRLPDENVHVLNYCKSLIKYYRKDVIFKYNTKDRRYMLIDSETEHIIETYIPSQKLLLVVEL